MQARPKMNVMVAKVIKYNLSASVYDFPLVRWRNVIVNINK